VEHDVVDEVCEADCVACWAPWHELHVWFHEPPSAAYFVEVWQATQSCFGETAERLCSAFIDSRWQSAQSSAGASVTVCVVSL
jgi:hypothetical protein